MPLSPDEARAIAIELNGYGHGLPTPMTPEWLEMAKAKGMIAKADLVDGMYYVGCCRNAYVARWDAKRSLFWYLRFKREHRFEESILHPEDDPGQHDLFVPTMKLFKEDMRQ